MLQRLSVIFLFEICIATNPLLLPKHIVGQESFRLFMKNKFPVITDANCVFDISGGRNEFMNFALQMSSNNIYKPRTFYIFTKNFRELTSSMKYVSRTNIHMLYSISKLKPFLDEIKDTIVSSRYNIYVFFVNDIVKIPDSALRDGLKNIWNTNIWNFKLIYYDEDYIDITYNPFTHEIIRLNDENKDKWDQLNKFNNLLKYKVSVTIYHDPPRVYLHKNKISGNYMRILNIIEEVINATFNIIQSTDAEDAYELVRNNYVEFSAIGQFHGIREGVKYGEPFKRDDIVVVVPKAEKLNQVEKLLRIFNYKVWILLLVTYAAFVFKIHLLTKKSIHILLLQLFGAITAIGSNFKSSHSLANVLYIGFVFMGLMVSYTFCSSLLSALLAKKFKAEINTLYDLLESNLTIFILQDHVKLIPNEFKAQLMIVTAKTFSENVIKGNNSIAYAGMKSYLEGLMNIAVYNSGEDIFHLVQESIVPGFESYIFHETSPFIHRINDVLKIIDESGLLINTLNTANKVKEEFQIIPLSLHELSIAFAFLGIGIVLSLIVFMVEVKSKHKCR